jgi:plasmid maintenance system killer protein
MESTLYPPARIHTASSREIPTKTAEKNVENFLENYQSRRSVSSGVDSSFTVQLQKIAAALHEERMFKKKAARE